MVEFDAGVFHGLGADGYDAFDDAASRADALFNQEAHNASDLRVFMAPEYLFSDISVTERGATAIGSMSSGDKIDIYKKLKRTSAAYPDMLIVAGSIAYTKGGFGRARKHLSVCPILANGQVLLKYYKRTHDQFQTGSSATTWDTKSYGSTFSYRGQTFGIEICLDHSPSFKTLKTAMGGGLVDIQMLVSAGSAPTRTAIAARTNGLVINCDMAGKGGGNGITPVTGYTARVPTVGAKNSAIIRTAPLTSGGQVTLYAEDLT
jgi:predicted amidohydrolase